METINKLAHIYKSSFFGATTPKGVALQGLLFGGGLTAGSALADSLHSVIAKKMLDSKKESALQTAISLHPKLQTKDQERLKLYYNTLWNFAPDIAQDPLAAGGILYQAMEMDAYGGFPADTLKTIIDIQSKKSQSKPTRFGDFLQSSGQKQVIPFVRAQSGE